MSGAPPLLELAGISKRFGDLVANDDISLSVAAGEVVALLGENGAGKSTLMKIVYGLVRPDAGAVRLDGRPLEIGSPRDAMAAGVGMVTQEFSLVDSMTVTENIALSGVGLGRIDARQTRRRVAEAIDRVGVGVDPEALVSSLSIGERQRVEIVKALFHRCRVLILDEPTAVLTPADVGALFRTVARLRSTGLGVLFVSHKLHEVAEISDRVVVLRRGRVVGERLAGRDGTQALAGRAGAQALASLMMGAAEGLARGPGEGSTAVSAVGLPRNGTSPSPGSDRRRAEERPAALRIRGLCLVHRGRPVLDGVSLTVACGEVLGLAGISGNGQTELMDVLSGVRSPTRGTIVVDGRDVTRADTAGRLAAGLGRLTENRRGSVIGQLSVEDNLVLEDLPTYARRGLLDRTAIRAHAASMIERFDIRAGPGDLVETLSGGNVQKVLLARALARRPRVLVVAQPTRGLDIGGYRYVHAQLRELSASGAGVLVISEDLDELLALCGRIAVLFRGRVVDDLRAADASLERLGLLMAGAGVLA